MVSDVPRGLVERNRGKLDVILKKGKGNPGHLRLSLYLVSIIILLVIIIKLFSNQNYRLTFIDSDTGEPVLENNIRVELLMEDESPKHLLSDETGSIIIRTNRSRIHMIIRAPYYLTDTVTRILKRFRHSEQINLNADYYALMISYFSESDVSSWERRREQLTGIFSDNAIIYQAPEKSGKGGMALYTKFEFIDKITMPSSGLQQIEILDCRYFNGKIAILRFRTKSELE